MYKAIKDSKIIAINDTGDFPCLVYDEVVEDTEHTAEDYVHCDGEFVLTTDDKAKVLENKEKVEKAHTYLEETDYVAIKIAEGVATKEDYAEILERREEARDVIRSLENG